MMIALNDRFDLLGLIFAGLLEIFFSFPFFFKKSTCREACLCHTHYFWISTFEIGKILLHFIWKWHKIWNGGNASSLRVFGKLVCGSCFLPFELVWCQYVLLIISIGIYYLRKGVYLIPLSKCVYREAQQYISMSRKQNIRNFNVVFYAC